MLFKSKAMRIGMGCVLMCCLLFLQGVVSAPVDTLIIQNAADPTEQIMTQPLPPPVEPGANLPLVCGGVVLLLIIFGGVIWNNRLKRAHQEDH